MKYLCKICIGLVLFSCGEKTSKSSNDSINRKALDNSISVLDSLKNLQLLEISKDYITIDGDTIYKTVLQDDRTVKITQRLSTPFSDLQIKEYQQGIKESVLDSTTKHNLEFVFDIESEYQLSTYILNVKHK